MEINIDKNKINARGEKLKESIVLLDFLLPGEIFKASDNEMYLVTNVEIDEKITCVRLNDGITEAFPKFMEVLWYKAKVNIKLPEPFEGNPAAKERLLNNK